MGSFQERVTRKPNRCSGREKHAHRDRVSPPSFGISFTLFPVLAHLFDSGLDSLCMRAWQRPRRRTGHHLGPRYGHRSRRQRRSWSQGFAGECRIQDGTHCANRGGQGEYQFLLIPPGTYTLHVTASGFRSYEQKGLALLVNTPATANVQLKVGATTEVVTVTSEAPALNLVDASVGDSFDEKQVRQIPLEGRNVPDLLSLQAGVAYTGNRIADKDQDTRNGAVN